MQVRGLLKWRLYSNMEHSEYAIRIVMSYGYTREEAINILDGKEADGSDFVALPF